MSKKILQKTFFTIVATLPILASAETWNLTEFASPIAMITLVKQTGHPGQINLLGTVHQGTNTEQDNATAFFSSDGKQVEITHHFQDGNSCTATGTVSKNNLAGTEMCDNGGGVFNWSGTISDSLK